MCLPKHHHARGRGEYSAPPHMEVGSGVLRALQAAVRELEGDASLGRRIRAAQELSHLLEGGPRLQSATCLDPWPRRVGSLRCSPSLLRLTPRCAAQACPAVTPASPSSSTTAACSRY